MIASTIETEGLREIVQALEAVDETAYATVTAGLHKAGDVVRDEARKVFTDYGDSLGRGATWGAAAEGFETLVRPNTSSMPLVRVGQTIRRSRTQQLRRSNFGDLFMRHGLLPALAAKEPEAAAIIESDVQAELHAAGF